MIVISSVPVRKKWGREHIHHFDVHWEHIHCLVVRKEHIHCLLLSEGKSLICLLDKIIRGIPPLPRIIVMCQPFQASIFIYITLNMKSRLV